MDKKTMIVTRLLKPVMALKGQPVMALNMFTVAAIIRSHAYLVPTFGRSHAYLVPTTGGYYSYLQCYWYSSDNIPDASVNIPDASVPPLGKKIPDASVKIPVNIPDASVNIPDASMESCNGSNIREQTIDMFWKNFYAMIDDSVSKNLSNVSLYHNQVIKLLMDNSKSNGESLSNEVLYNLQLNIEDLTMNFDERTVFNSVPSLINLLISSDMITAKEYLMQKSLSSKDLAYLDVFGKYTVEAIIIHVLGSVFNCVQDLAVVRVSTLIDRLDSNVRVQAVNMGMTSQNDVKINQKSKSIKRKVTRSNSAIGVCLVEFLVERELITILTSVSDKLPVSNTKGKGYIPLNCYVMCNFDLSLLPIKFNLPMIYEPLPWKFLVDVPLTLSDMSGGYLSGFTGDIYNRFRLLTSRNYDYFYIKLHSPELLCNVLNKLQSQAFKINIKVMKFIMDNRETLEEEGLLMKRCLSKVNVKDASDLLRNCYLKDEHIHVEISFDKLLTELYKRVQRARYEEFVLILATAYAGYQFYLPAFMDFRGRIYRAGVLHFHEGDLARSLIVFASDAQAPEELFKPEDMASLRMNLACAAAFKYQKFTSLSKAYSWYISNSFEMIDSDKGFIHFAEQASYPYQFLANLILFERVSIDSEIIRGFNIFPVTQDASASGYQIMSYLLLNADMGMRTNLLPSPDLEIQDLYLSLKDELKEFLRHRLDNIMYATIESRLTRKLVKQIFMPLLYGKTVITMASDIHEYYGYALRLKESYNIAKLCHEYWVKKYPDIANLMKLINLIGWICSVLDKPVFYTIPYFTTVQDYMRSDKAHIWVYDRVCFKRHRVTLQVPTSDRDKRKTKVATCVNFIHQKDAFIAMRVVEQLIMKKAPVYTVHDNFITTSVYAAGVPKMYTKVFMEMGPPLRIINSFILTNLLVHPGELNEPYHWYSERFNDPIPGEYLRTRLITLLPDSKWNHKIDETVSCYEQYVNTVCGSALPPEGGMRNADKWNEFHSLLQSWESIGFNYSLHY